ncbi:MAG: TonB-dependent receptor [Bacteroidota bacterium]|nr:TonB-dependent receptor [Bacteroidota bacterium]
MKIIFSKTSVFLKVLLSTLFIFSCFFSLKAREMKSPFLKDVYVIINNSNTNLQNIFTIIEKQTSFSFVYDENDINLSKQIKLTKGKQLLKDVLSNISKQSGLHFTEKQNVILVNSEPDKIKDTGLKSTAALITGTVQDENSAPLIGVTVSIKGSKIAAQTDGNGNFSINAPENAVLVFSIVGYKTKEVSVNGQASINVKMEATNKELNEVVVVGYQSRRRGDLSGAVSVVDVGGISKLPVLSVDQALEGKVPGVRITQNTGQPGDGVQVRIRGVGTINDNNPLFIVDGIPTKDGINFLSANDIESIVVLKDASSAAIYGSRAANGVVLVTTKGGKKGKAQFNYSGYGGFQTHGTLPKMANTSEYVQLYNEAADNDNAGVTNPALIRPKIPADIPMANTDWLKGIFQKGQIQSHQLSVRGGNEKTLYYISANYFKQDGIIINSSYERYSLLSKLNIELTDKLSLGNNINVSYSKKNIIGASGDGYGGNGGSVVRYALFRTPAIPIYDSSGVYSDLPAYPAFFGDGYNPVALANNTDNKEIEYRVFANLYAEYKILTNLKFRSDIGLDAIITDDKRFDVNYGTNLRINNPSRLTVSTNTNMNIVWNNTLTYNKTFNSVHNVSVLAGTEAISNKNNLHGGADRDFPNQTPAFRYIGNGSGLIGSTTAFESQAESALFSLFANANYSYRNLYLLSANVRRDGSSRFGPDNQYGTFYSGSIGWNAHNEKWVQDHLSSVSKLKLRASYGQLGNQEIPDYGFVSIIGNLYNYPFGQTPVSNPGSTISTLGNPKVKWESSTQADAGVDVSVWRDKLSFTADYFIKTTSNMLIPIPFPLIGGSAKPPYLNAGKVQNKGLELELGYRNNDHLFKYDLNVNFSTLKNEVLSLSNGQPIAGGRIDNNYNATLTAVGHPIGSFFLYEQAGIFQNAADVFASAYQGKNIQPGDVKFKDQNGDGVINENDRVFLGSAIPKYTFGATANFEYKNFDLSAFFQGQYGNKIYSQVNMDIEGFYRAFNVTQRVYDERWHGEGTSNTMPRVSFNGASNNKYPSSRFLEDGSYVRLKNLQIGYTIPDKIVSRFRIKTLRLYVTGQNLWTLTKYTGLDPEMTISDNVKKDTYGGDVGAGIDWGTYPSAKSYIIGLNLNF